MKKHINLLLLAIVLPFMMFAQSPGGRTAKTIVADVMAQMPSQSIEKLNIQMHDLAGKADETVAILTDMLYAPGKGDNTKMEFALGGLTTYISTPGHEQERKDVINAYIRALDKTNEREIKAFIIRQLQIAGGNESIDVLKKYAVSKELDGDALRALSAIGSPEAKQAVESIFTQIPNRVAAAKVAGNLDLTSMENELISWLNTGDAQLQKSIVNSLGRIGGANTLAVLSKEVDQNSYQYDPSGTLEAYLKVLARVPFTSVSKTVSKLLKNQDANVRAAAITILANANSPLALTAALKSVSDPSRPYRNHALEIVEPIADETFYISLRDDAMPKASDVAKTDIINRFGELKWKKSIDAVAPYINSKNEELQIAAINTLSLIATDKSIEPILGLLVNGNDTQIKNAESALRWTHKDIRPELASTLSAASNTGKIAIINLLAARAASDSAPALIALTNNTDKAISSAAFSSLKSVATVKELPELYKMLESASNDNVSAIQEAIGSAVAGLDPDQALATISKQMNATSAAKKYLYYATLSYTASPNAFKVIAEGIKSSDKNIQNASIESALGWKGTEAIQTVYEIIENSALASIQPKAVDSYINLVKDKKYNDQQKYLFLRKALDKAKVAKTQNALLAEMGSLNSFGALITAGKYLSKPETKHMAGTAVMRIAQKDKTYANWSDETATILKLFVATREGGDAGYEKTAIQKYLNEAPKDAKFVKIFNEKDLTGWKGLVQNPIARNKMDAKTLAAEQAKADEIMRKGWEVRNGDLIFTGHGDNLCTDKKYGDFEMWCDWFIEPDGDAGLYLRGTPQVQIWDTCRVDVGAQVGSGGLYNNSKNPSKPLLLADNRIGDWNTFYVKMVGERVTVVLNGVTVVDNVILENYWDRALPIFIEEQIELQAHGTLVGYRDIFVKELPNVKPYELSDAEKKDGFKLLFDGVSMNQWIGNTKDYVAENGTITLYPGNGGGGNLYTKDEYKDFVFRFDFMLTEAANNGLGIRTPLEGDAAYQGMELQILDNEHPVYKDLAPYQYHGSVYGVIPSKRGFLKPVGEWNSQEVYIKGNDIKITLNGEVILEGNIAEASKNGTADKNNHPGLKNEKGHIGFLGHGSLVKFKDIRVKEIKK